MITALAAALLLAAPVFAEELAPPKPSRPVKRRVESGMLLTGSVNPSNATYDGTVRMSGMKTPRLGVKGPKLKAPAVSADRNPSPLMFEHAPIAADSPALAREPAALEAAPAAKDKRRLIAAIAAACLLLISLLARGRSRTMTHD